MGAVFTPPEITKDFDIVISNPPYGKIGAEITHAIIDNVNYKEFVNLLPANDYHRGKDDLYKYTAISKMIPINGGFSDAAVTTHLTKINKKPSTITEDEFEIENYIDDSLKKYFYENTKRSHYAIDNCKHSKVADTLTTYAFGHRDINHGCLPFKGNIYRYNFIEDIDINYLINNTSNDIFYCKFNTREEKVNFRSFLKQTNLGYKFYKKICKAMNVDSAFPANLAFPKVDWTREWTVEGILKNYKYSEAEIKEVMDDLVNFKGMDS